MSWTKRLWRSGIAGLVFGALVVSVSPALAADTATDITAEDVRLVNDIEPGPGDSFPREFTVFGDRVLFGAQDSVSEFELWATDGTPAGTTLVKDINPGLPSGSGPAGLTVFGDRVLFSTDDGVHGIELWVTDGTAAGTMLVKDISPGRPGGLRYSGSLTVFGDRVLFAADDGVHGPELWVTDGTGAGTTLVKDISPGPTGGLHGSDLGDGHFLTALGDRVLFATNDGASGGELWVTDATPAGTMLVKDTSLCGECNWPRGFVVFGDELLFTAGDGASGAELWSTDGTATGTHLVKDVLPGPDGSWPGGFAAFGNRVLFMAKDGESRDLWVTDGMAAGTQLLKDFPPGPRDDYPGGFTVFGDRALFAASDGVSGRDLWVTDGTTAGTQLVKDVLPGPRDGQPGGLTVFGDRVLFTADNGLYGRALWSTDGTADGTVLVKELDPAGAGDVWGLTVFGDRVLFSGSDSRSRGEVWVTDGTAAGTELFTEINPTGDAFASGFTVFGDQVLFTADDGVHGTELWSVTTGLWAQIDGQITRLYQAAFGRAPHPASLDYWADRYRAGSSLTGIADSFIDSAEFAARNGTQPTHSQIVDVLYQNVLGRAGSQTGRTYWIGLLDTGTSRGDALVAFSESPANVARTGTIAAFTSAQSKVLRLYHASFGRVPDVAGFAYWTSVLNNRDSLTDIAAQFRTSPEFTQRYGPNLDNETFIRLLYTNVLDRAPDPDGLAYWLAQLDTTLTRDQVLVAFSESPENIHLTSTIP